MCPAWTEECSPPDDLADLLRTHELVRDAQGVTNKDTVDARPEGQRRRSHSQNASHTIAAVRTPAATAGHPPHGTG